MSRSARIAARARCRRFDRRSGRRQRTVRGIFVLTGENPARHRARQSAARRAVPAVKRFRAAVQGFGDRRPNSASPPGSPGAQRDRRACIGRVSRLRSLRLARRPPPAASRAGASAGLSGRMLPPSSNFASSPPPEDRLRAVCHVNGGVSGAGEISRHRGNGCGFRRHFGGSVCRYGTEGKSSHVPERYCARTAPSQEIPEGAACGGMLISAAAPLR